MDKDLDATCSQPSSGVPTSVKLYQNLWRLVEAQGRHIYNIMHGYSE